MVAIFARQQAPVIAAEQKVGAAERFQLVAMRVKIALCRGLFHGKEDMKVLKTFEE